MTFLKIVVFIYKIWVLLTSVIRSLVKDSKIEIIGKFYVKKITFLSFNVMNASIPRQKFLFRLLNKYP